MRVSKTSWHYRIQNFTFGTIPFEHLCPYFHMTWLAIVLAPLKLMWVITTKPLVFIVNKLSNYLGAPLDRALQRCGDFNRNRILATEEAKKRAYDASYIKTKEAFLSKDPVRVASLFNSLKKFPEQVVIGRTDGMDLRYAIEYKYRLPDAVRDGLSSAFNQMPEFDPKGFYVGTWRGHQIENFWDAITARHQIEQMNIDDEARRIRKEIEVRRKLRALKAAKVVTFIGQLFITMLLTLVTGLILFLGTKSGIFIAANLGLFLWFGGSLFVLLAIIYTGFYINNRYENIVVRGVECAWDTFRWVVKSSVSWIPKVLGPVWTIVTWPFGKIRNSLYWLWYGLSDIIEMGKQAHEGICPQLDFKD